MKMYDIASRLAFFLADQVNLEDSSVDRVRYGLELILGELIKWLILFILSIVLGVLPEVAFGMFSMLFYRLVSGGNHCEDYWRCLSLGIIVFIGSGLVSRFTQQYLTYSIVLYAIIGGAIIMALLAVIWAPGEVVHRKIKLEERKSFKILSLIFLLLWTAFEVFVILPNSPSVALAGLMVMTVQSVSFTPAGYLIIAEFDFYLSKILGERRCHSV